jgi:hypothetical protein
MHSKHKAFVAPHCENRLSSCRSDLKLKTWIGIPRHRPSQRGKFRLNDFQLMWTSEFFSKQNVDYLNNFFTKMSGRSDYILKFSGKRYSSTSLLSDTHNRSHHEYYIASAFVSAFANYSQHTFHKSCTNAVKSIEWTSCYQGVIYRDNWLLSKSNPWLQCLPFIFSYC